MILETGNTLSRYLYPQTGDYRAVLNAKNMPSYLGLSLQSGVGSTMTFLFDNKKYKNYNNRFSHVYETGGDFKFELVKSGNQINTWINNILAESYIKASGYINLIDTVHLFGATTNTDLSFSFYGDSPNLTFTEILPIGSNNYSGSIINSSFYGTRLFSITGDAISATYPSVVSGNSTGTYIFSGDFVNSFVETDLTFDFDFGRRTHTLHVDDVTYTPAVGTGFVNFSIDATSLKDEEFINFNVGYYDVSDKNLSIELEHLGRIGGVYYTGSGIGTGFYSGYLNGEGYLTSYGLTGYISGYLGTGYGAIYSYATGTVITDYTIEVSGYESGVLATGYLQGYLTGIVNPGSGIYNFSGLISGIPTISIGGMTIFSNPTGMYTGGYNFYQNAVGNFLIYSSGDMPYAASSAPATINGIQNHFILRTGEPGGVLVDYTSNNWYSGNIFSNGGNTYPSGGLVDIEGEIGYISGSLGVVDLGRLTVSGGITNYSVDIYGTLTNYNENDRVFQGYVVRDVGGNPRYKSIYYYPLTDTTVEE